MIASRRRSIARDRIPACSNIDHDLPVYKKTAPRNRGMFDTFGTDENRLVRSPRKRGLP